ncbi:hypothetical protein [Paenarthrobacter sp. PH39-S1]|nr:hypothetical protein [Paenarthrobacter sp. PH39-S1]MDJ0355341.1 hypothetical protein [Paenarthrobacter sp. PH39-S1]
MSRRSTPPSSIPEAYIQFKDGLMADDVEVTVESTAQFLGHLAQ